MTPWTIARQASLSFTIPWSLLKLMSSESVVPSNYLILCCPLVLLPPIFPSIGIFSNELVLCIRWPKYWSFSISPSNEYSGLISFRIELIWSPCSPRHSQESSPAPQFKSINSLTLSLLYLTSLHDYWKNHSLGPLYIPTEQRIGWMVVGGNTGCYCYWWRMLFLTGWNYPLNY